MHASSQSLYSRGTHTAPAADGAKLEKGDANVMEYARGPIHFPIMNVEIVNGEPYLPGAAALLEQLDKKIIVILRDGRHLVGILRSFDQFLNLVMQDTCERVILSEKYCDIPLGLYIVRGDNIVLLGELDDAAVNPKLVEISPDELAEATATSEAPAVLPWDFES